jgi:hypothetical protein
LRRLVQLLYVNLLLVRRRVVHEMLALRRHVICALVLLVLRLHINLLLLLSQQLLLPLLLLVRGRMMDRVVVLATRIHVRQRHVSRRRHQLHNGPDILNRARHISAAQLDWPRNVWKLPRLAVEHDMDPILCVAEHGGTHKISERTNAIWPSPT